MLVKEISYEAESCPLNEKDGDSSDASSSSDDEPDPINNELIKNALKQIEGLESDKNERE